MIDRDRSRQGHRRERRKVRFARVLVALKETLVGDRGALPVVIAIAFIVIFRFDRQIFENDSLAQVIEGEWSSGIVDESNVVELVFVAGVFDEHFCLGTVGGENGLTVFAPNVFALAVDPRAVTRRFTGIRKIKISIMDRIDVDVFVAHRMVGKDAVIAVIDQLGVLNHVVVEVHVDGDTGQDVVIDQHVFKDAVIGLIAGEAIKRVER